MEIQLTKSELEKFVDDEVRSGHFSSPAEVVEAGLARLMLDPDPEEFDSETLAAIERADAEFERGEDRPFEEVAAELRRRHLGK